MELLKNIAAVIGLVISICTMCGIFIKPIRRGIAGLFVRYGHTDEVNQSISEMNQAISEVKSMLENHIVDYEAFRKEDECENSVLQEFIKAYCRSVTTHIFYNYLGTRVLPLYERKTLNTMKELYINTLRGNSYASILLTEMDKWQVDYTQTVPDEGHDGL